MRHPIKALFQYKRSILIHFKSFMYSRWGSRTDLQTYISKIDPSFLPPLLKKYGAKMGQNVSFNGTIRIDNSQKSPKPFQNLHIGNHCFIGSSVFFDLPEIITLEDHSILSAGVSILTHQDCGDRPMSKYYQRKTGAVTIGRGSWVGANVTILAGVSIGEMCVIAAGSVVTSDVEPYSVAAGIPAKIVKRLDSKLS